MMPAYKHYLYMVASIVLSSVAQLSMKAGMLVFHTQVYQPGAMLDVVNEPSAVLWVLAGLSCYALSLLFWMSAIARLELSFAYPMLSLSYVLVYLVAANWALLHEPFSMGRSTGILIVILGVVLVTQSGPKQRD
jgi:undecaprenyl phosphate-alpha-L-ara4N flippase subunit ArnF